MVRETSSEAYFKIKEDGLLSERRWRVYDILFKNGPLIGSEVAALYYSAYGRTAASETIRNRLTELRDSGSVSEVGKAIDKKTGMNVILWDVTKKLPIKLVKTKKTKCPHCKGTGVLNITQQMRLFK